MSKRTNSSEAAAHRIEELGLQGRPVRARAYLRVSMARGQRLRTMVSHEMQFEYAKRYCEYHGFELDEPASWRNADLDESAFERPWLDRPGILGHFLDAKQGDFDVLVFFKISRMARDVYEGLDMINAFERAGVVFHFVEDKVDGSSAQGRMMRTLMLAFAEMQSEDLSAFVKAACRHRAEQGRYHGGRTPSWIRRVGKDRFELIPEVAAAYRRMIELRCEGTSYYRIASTLNEEGYRNAAGEPWEWSWVHRVLTPAFLDAFAGYTFYHRGKSDSMSFRLYPPLLNDEELERLKTAQRLYSASKNRTPDHGYLTEKERKERTEARHLLTPLLRCPHCGAGKTGVSYSHDRLRSGRDGEGRYYGCPRAPYDGPADDLHEGLVRRMEAQRAEDAALRVLRVCLGDPLPVRVEPPRRIERVDYGPRLEALDRRVETLVSLLALGRLSEADFDRLYDQAKGERAVIQGLKGEGEKRVEEQEGRIDARTRERLALRRLIGERVERIVGPLYSDVQPEATTKRGYREPALIRTNGYKMKPRAFLLVTMMEPNASGTRQFLSPLYSRHYRGPRFVVPVVGELRVEGETFVSGDGALGAPIALRHAEPIPESEESVAQGSCRCPSAQVGAIHASLEDT